jgi:hypothetical protein
VPTPPPDWPPEALVPPLSRRDGTPLPRSDIFELLRLLREELAEPIRPTMEAPHPAQPWRRARLPQPLRDVFNGLCQQCGDPALDAWMATLLRAWLHDLGTGTARKIRWVVPAAAVIGGDACAALIGAHMRVENFNMRCSGEIGIYALVDIGTRGAYLELAHIGRKFASKSRGHMARQALETVAAEQGLTPDQLQERILPDGGLDATGRRRFDYGPRQFELLLDEHLMPVLRAPDGKRITTLPKPTAKDDGVRATDARNAWKVANTQIQQTARWLATRFENAMIAGDSWSPAEFNAHFRRHPLARHVVGRLLWTCEIAGSDSPRYFRVAEDGTLATVDDTPIELPEASTGIRPAHPLHLEPDVRARWQTLFADYQIVSPFAQLDRPVFRVAADAMAIRHLTSFPHPQVDVKALIFPLENRGWVRASSADGGLITQHSRVFVRHDVRACLEFSPGAFLGDLPGSGVQTLDTLFFVASEGRGGRDQALALGDVPPMVYSETLRDLHVLIPAG